MEEPPIYTATIVFYHVWDVNLITRSTETYTTTYSNSAGVYTLWPLVRDKQWAGIDKIETLSMPVTITPQGGLQTCTEPVPVATRSPAMQRISATRAESTASISSSTTQVAAPVATKESSEGWTKPAADLQNPATSSDRMLSPGAVLIGFLFVVLVTLLLRRRLSRRVQLDQYAR